MNRLSLSLLAFLPLAFAAAAQDGGAGDPASDEQFRATQALIERMQAKIKAIDSVATARDRDIEFLNKKIEEAIRMISTGREESAGLRDANVGFQEELKDLYAKEGELSAKLTDVEAERESQVADFESRIASLIDRLGAEQRATDDLKEETRTLESRIASLTERLGAEQRATDGLRDEARTLTARLQAAQEARMSAERALREARRAMTESERNQARRLKEIESLNGEIRVLKEMLLAERRRLAEHEAKMADQQAKMADQQTKMADQTERMADQQARMAEQEAQLAELERRLKAALARKVEELSGYRSEFFGRLRQALGGRQDIRMVGDRFVFQSEVLFASGKANLDPQGEATLKQLARTLNEVARKIPADLNWILRVDGHTDRLPIRTEHWKSNWDLSSARALSVVRFLIEEGVPPHRLAATGFGKFQPLDPRDDEIAYRRNRRIEFKLTQR